MKPRTSPTVLSYQQLMHRLQSGVRQQLLWSALDALMMVAVFVSLYHLLAAVFTTDAHAWLPAMLMFMLAFAASLGVSVYSYRFGMTLGYAMGYQVRLSLAEHLRQLPMGFFRSNTLGELNSRLIKDVDLLEMLFTHFFGQMVHQYVLSLGLLLGLLWLSWWLALCLLVGILLALLLYWLGQRRVQSLAQDKQQHLERLVSQILEYSAGIITFRAYGLAGKHFQRLHKVLHALQRSQWRMEVWSFASLMGYNVVLEWSLLLMIALGLWAQASDSAVAPWLLFFMLMYGYRLLQPLQNFAIYLSLSRLAGNSLYRLRRVFVQAPLTIHSAALPNSLTPSIEFRDVSFQYAHDPYIQQRLQDNTPCTINTGVQDINCTLHPNQFTVLVGTSGSGKTTLTRLLARFYDVQAGAILLGGVDIRSLPSDILMQQLTVVFQDTYLLHASIRENLRFAYPQASEAELRQATQQAQCHDFIQALPQGYETVLGEGGATLSGGQKQRLGIARALLKPAPIVILDEPSAALDAENSALLQQAIQALARHKTVLMIAHHLPTIQHADQILVMHQGRLVQQGKHEDLIHSVGLYAALFL